VAIVPTEVNEDAVTPDARVEPVRLPAAAAAGAAQAGTPPDMLRIWVAVPEIARRLNWVAELA